VSAEKNVLNRIYQQSSSHALGLDFTVAYIHDACRSHTVAVISVWPTCDDCFYNGTKYMLQ